MQTETTQNPEQTSVSAQDVTTLQELAALPKKKEPMKLTAYEQSKTAYQKARRAEYERVREQQRQELEQARLQRLEEEEQRLREQGTPRKHMSRQQRKAYAVWLFDIGEDEAARAVHSGAMSREEVIARFGDRPHSFKALKILALLAAVLIAGFVLTNLLAFRQPVAERGLGQRRSGVSTILLAGTDAGGFRTDSMMLLSIDTKEKSVSLLSIPRDTLIYCEYTVPKLNSAYGWASGGEAGMEQLMHRVTEIVGFLPDGYILADLSVFEKLVDLFGGADFDVPMNMYYEDASQDLLIDLPMGMQHLDGEAACALMRFRSGYPDADLGRVSVQRSFLLEALRQWVDIRSIDKAAPAIRLIRSSTVTDLSVQELLWLLRGAVGSRMNTIRSRTLPGEFRQIAGSSYYVLSPQDVADTVNDCCNPYVENVTADGLSVRIG